VAGQGGLLVGLQREREEKRRDEEEMGSVAEFDSILKSSKFGPSGVDDGLRSDF
jgi:hypothetical protein